MKTRTFNVEQITAEQGYFLVNKSEWESAEDKSTVIRAKSVVLAVSETEEDYLELSYEDYPENE